MGNAYLPSSSEENEGDRPQIPNSHENVSRWYFEQFPGVFDWNKEGFALPDVEEPYTLFDTIH